MVTLNKGEVIRGRTKQTETLNSRKKEEERLKAMETWVGI